MWVIEQGPGWQPRFRQIPYESGITGSYNYINNAWYYNVIEICPTCEPPKKKK